MTNLNPTLRRSTSCVWLSKSSVSQTTAIPSGQACQHTWCLRASTHSLLLAIARVGREPFSVFVMSRAPPCGPVSPSLLLWRFLYIHTPCHLGWGRFLASQSASIPSPWTQESTNVFLYICCHSWIQEVASFPTKCLWHCQESTLSVLSSPLTCTCVSQLPCISGRLYRASDEPG